MAICGQSVTNHGTVQDLRLSGTLICLAGSDCESLMEPNGTFMPLFLWLYV